MNTNIELIRQKCIEANPDAEERVWKFSPADFIDFREYAMGVPAHFQYWLVKLTEMHAAIRLWEQGIKPDGKGESEVRVYEHRPIRLADVLLAIGEVVDRKFTDGAIPENFAHLSRAAENERERRWIIALQHYDLRNDDLNEQSEETINFLASLFQ